MWPEKCSQPFYVSHQAHSQETQEITEGLLKFLHYPLGGTEISFKITNYNSRLSAVGYDKEKETLESLFRKMITGIDNVRFLDQIFVLLVG